MHIRSALLGCIFVLAHCAAFGAEGVLTTSVGADFSSGDYGKRETTEAFALQLAAKYETGRWTYRFSVPWLRISGPSNVIGAGADGVVLPGEVGDRRRVSGLGDVVAGAAYTFGGTGSAYAVDVGAKVKLPTADEAKGLGTGKADVSVQADFFRRIGALTPFATLGYRRYGDPAAFELENAVFGALGLAYAESPESTVGAAYDFREAIVAGGARAGELSLFLSQRLKPNWKLQVYLVKGLAEASPDAGVGAVLGYSF
jgi:hypothetical protein